MRQSMLDYLPHCRGRAVRGGEHLDLGERHLAVWQFLTLGHVGRHIVVDDDWSVEVRSFRQGSSGDSCNGEEEGSEECKELHGGDVRVSI